MTKAKRCTAFIIIIAIFFCAAFCGFPSYALTDISLGVNDSLVDAPGGIRPVFVNNVCYVPIDVFEKYFSLSYSYDGVSRTLTVFGGSHSLSFDMRQNIATDDEFQVYYVTCYYDNSTFMVPARVMCDVFGLRYSFITSLNTVRIRLPAAMSDDAFVQRHRDTLIPKPQTPSGNGNKDVVSDVYLIFASPSAKKLDGILKALDNAGVKATFFVCAGTMSSDPSYIAKISAHGHDIGIDLTDVLEGQDFNEEMLLSHVNGMSFDIAKIYKINTNAVYVGEEYAARVKVQAFSDSGYTVWSSKAVSSAAAVTSRIEGRSRTTAVLIDETADVSSVVRGVARFLSDNKASFDTIRITSKP